MSFLPWLTLACQCGTPGLPPDTDPPTLPTPPPPTPVETGDPPQCDWVETEPNNTPDQANALPLEQAACGNFDSPNGDSDNWTFTVPFATWIGIDVEAERVGSLANPAAVLIGDDLSIARNDDDEGGDVSLLLPLAPGDYDLQLIEQNLSGGTDGRWFYDLQVSEQKAPTSWTMVEADPNDTLEAAQLVANGDAVYGTIDGPTDEDWLRIDIPTGRHTLTVRTTAFGAGSPLDGMIQLRDADDVSPGCASAPDCRFERGETGFEADPFARYTSEGDESIWIRFRNQLNGGSSVHWYVLEISLEAS